MRLRLGLALDEVGHAGDGEGLGRSTWRGRGRGCSSPCRAGWQPRRRSCRRHRRRTSLAGTAVPRGWRGASGRERSRCQGLPAPLRCRGEARRIAFCYTPLEIAISAARAGIRSAVTPSSCQVQRGLLGARCRSRSVDEAGTPTPWGCSTTPGPSFPCRSLPIRASSGLRLAHRRGGGSHGRL